MITGQEQVTQRNCFSSRQIILNKVDKVARQRLPMSPT